MTDATDDAHGSPPEPAPSTHPPAQCMQIHDVSTSIEKIDHEQVWIRVDCPRCGDGRCITYSREDESA